MATSAEGIVEEAATFRGIAREFVQVVLMDYSDEPLPNTKCTVTFQNGKSILVESDDEGIIKFPKKAEGEVEIELLEEEEEVTES